MPIDRRRLILGSLLLISLVAACSSAGAISSEPAATTPTPIPSASLPAATPVPSGSAGPIIVAPSLPITTAADAMAAIVVHDHRFAGIMPFDAQLIGQPAWYKASPASGVGAFVVTIQMGWGDCPAGCIDKHQWRFAVLPDGGVTLQSETGSPLGPDGMPPTEGS